MKWTDRFRDALAPLSWGFDEGDDGDPIALALDTVDSLLRQLPLGRLSRTKTLGELLREIGIGVDDVASVQSLSDLLDQSAFYDGGLSARQAREVSLLAQDVAAVLAQAAELAQRKPMPGKAKSGRIRHSRPKRVGGRRG